MRRATEIERTQIYSGEAQGLRETRRALTFLRGLPEEEPLLLDFSPGTATTDFIEPLVQCLLYPGEKLRPFPGRKVLCLNPDATTLFAVARSLEAGKTCALALQTRDFPWTLQLVGHLEPHLDQLMRYLREHPGATTQEMLQAELGRSQGNIGGRIKELFDLGLVERSLIEKAPGADRRSERQYRYYGYHPLRALFPLFPAHLLPYARYRSPRYCAPDLPASPQSQERAAPREAPA